MVEANLGTDSGEETIQRQTQSGQNQHGREIAHGGIYGKGKIQTIAAQAQIMNDEAQHHIQESSPHLVALSGCSWSRRESYVGNGLAAMRTVGEIFRHRFAAIDALSRPQRALLKHAHATIRNPV